MDAWVMKGHQHRSQSPTLHSGPPRPSDHWVFTCSFPSCLSSPNDINKTILILIGLGFQALPDSLIDAVVSSARLYRPYKYSASGTTQLPRGPNQRLCNKVCWHLHTDFQCSPLRPDCQLAFLVATANWIHQVNGRANL